MRRLRNIVRSLGFALVLWGLASLPAGCSKDEGPNDPGSGGVDPAPYGTGTVAFDAPGAGGAFHATGPYAPSTEFADDTASQGSGGFLHDTLSGGKPYQARLNAYIHTLRGGFMSERVLIAMLNNDAGPLAPGTYDVLRPDSSGTGMTARVTYLFFSDSLAQYAAYDGVSGTITITALDTVTREISGTFSVALQGTPPDTWMTGALAGGTFELLLSKRYYIY